MATSGLPKVTTEKAWIEVIGSSQRRKTTTPSTQKVEPEKRRVYSVKKLYRLKNQKRI